MLRFYIPFVRTLLPATTGTVSRKHVHSAAREDGSEVVTEFVEQVPYERVLKSLPIGNYKWCVPRSSRRGRFIP